MLSETLEALWRSVFIAAIRSGLNASEACKQADYAVGYYRASKLEGVFNV